MNMRSRSENMLQGIEYLNWYQVIRPIGFSVNEKSRVEILKVADESELRLRDNIPWGLRRKSQDSRMLQDTDLQQLASYHSDQQIEPNSEGVPNAASAVTKQQETNSFQTHLSPRLKDFQDQDKEIEEIFWELMKSIHPICPDDVDVEAIRKALAERQAKLGREKKERSEEDIFDKYGLGMSAHKKPDENVESTKQDLLGPPRNELFDMIDRMAKERMTPEQELKDMYDKNTPKKGKVGFRRNETGEGPRIYTDLDEVLSFGDLENDFDLKKYMVQQKRGRFDSEGNFIPGMYDDKGNFIPGIYDRSGNFTPGHYDSKGNFIAGVYDSNGNFTPGRYDTKGNFIPGIDDGKGGFTPGKYDSKGHFIPGKVDSRGTFIAGRFKSTFDGSQGERKKSRKKSRRIKGDTDSDNAMSTKSKRGKSLADMTESERQKHLEDLRKAKRHPEIDFPMCNYPKWVHRMYRMDQVKIGQLIKQGMDVPEYTPPWMLATLDRVWRNKDPKSRGEKPSSDPKKGKSRFGESDQTKKSGRKGKTVGLRRGGDLGKKGSREGTEGEDENQEKGSEEGDGGEKGKEGIGGKRDIDGKGGNDGEGQAGKEGAKEDGFGTDNSLTGGLGGLADFLQGYETEMVDLARLEADAGGDETIRRKKGGTSFDVDDLLEHYHNELLREENMYKQDKDGIHKKAILEEKARKIKEMQEAALKRIQDKEKKLKQEEEIKKQEKAEEDLKLKEQREKLQRQKEPGSRDMSRMSIRSRLYGKSKGRKGKGRADKKSTLPETEPCDEFKASQWAKARDDECAKRFQILLGRKKSRFLGGTDFLELAKQIELFKYPPLPPKKTPCERVELPICR